MTPIFSRIWFVNRQTVFARLRLPASLRIACDIIRAWRPTWLLAHLALELDPRRQRGDRVDRDDVDGAGADQDVDDLERLLAVVGLGDQQLVGVDADPAGVDRVERVLGVDEGADAATCLGLGDDVVDERRLARGLRAEDLDDPAARDAADPERDIERERARRDRSRPARSPCRRASSPSRRRIACRSATAPLSAPRPSPSLPSRRPVAWLVFVCHLLHHLFCPVREDGKSTPASRSYSAPPGFRIER